mgnify:CR=1 FL=1
MDICNVMLALGGDRRNTVPKYDVTPAEIAVLQAIHGDDAVTDIEVKGEKEKSNREELSRLRQIYGRARPEGGDVAYVDVLFPGAAARVFQTIDELELNEIFFKAEGRAVPSKTDEGSQEGKTKKTSKKSTKKADETGAGSDDGVGDINDAHSENGTEGGSGNSEIFG